MKEEDLEPQINWGYIKNELIRTRIPPERKKILEQNSITEQDCIDNGYDAIIQSIYPSLIGKYFQQAPSTYVTNKAIDDFLKNTKEKKLQKHNYLLSTDLWNEVMVSKKENISKNQFKKPRIKFNRKTNQFEVSYLELSSSVNNKIIKYPVLTDIRFNINIDFCFDVNTISEIISKKTQVEIEKLFSESFNSKHIFNIANLANNCEEFSIHKYYLPYGISQDNIDKSILLFRYDHSYLKHKNKNMPELYEKVYDKEVNEPHFHFTRGYGSIYKLTNKMNNCDFGAGYAISITNLSDYLMKLKFENFKDEKEKKLFMENDFGMPFLNYYINDQQKFNSIEEKVYNLRIFNSLNEKEMELKTAYDVCNEISSTKRKQLVYINEFDDSLEK